jgi:7-cyano-7-deazaguanine synthase
MTKSLVLLSGGQDSTTALYLTMDRQREVSALAFDYGQDHANEVAAAARIAHAAGVPFDVTPIPRLQLGGESPVVPVRNTIMLAIAANRAVHLGCEELVIGCCMDDAELFPDCRPEFLDSFEQSLVTGGCRVRIEAPLVQMDKPAIWKLAGYLGILDVIVDDTRTCYRGYEEQHAWGRGCGECLACETRAKGWQTFKAT